MLGTIVGAIFPKATKNLATVQYLAGWGAGSAFHEQMTNPSGNIFGMVIRYIPLHCPPGALRKRNLWFPSRGFSGVMIGQARGEPRRQACQSGVLHLKGGANSSS